ncbi:site-2 protease family protein [Candidatus Woesearchaeota archaeon]|nr:site-2 protease family protein [Candidatus Woesearchaeota archaeon]
MNLDLLLLLVFLALIAVFYFTHKNKFEIQNKIFALYKTRLGLEWMDKFARRHPKLLKYLAYVGIAVGFFGMVAMFVILIKATFDLLFVPDSLPALAPVLPGIKIAPGLPTLSFLHWIISIFLIAIVHEFSHGVIARVYNIKIKSSGFAFLGPIPAAFVEPDEKKMEKLSVKAQLSILAAGSFSNILLGLLVILLLAFASFFTNSLLEGNGVIVSQVVNDGPLDLSGINNGENITKIDDVSVGTVEEFYNELSKKKPGQEIILQTDKGTSSVVLGEQPKELLKSRGTIGYLGVGVSPASIDYKQEAVGRYGKTALDFIFWLRQLLFWIWVISLGVGLFNLLPLGPVDGGRMFFLGMMTFVGKEKAMKTWKVATVFLLLLLIINLLPWLMKLLRFIFG